MTMRRNWSRRGSGLWQFRGPRRLAHGAHSTAGAGVSILALAASISFRIARSASRTLTPLADERRSGVCLAARFSRRRLLLQGLLVDAVDLAQRDDLGLFGKAMAIGFEFAAHCFIGFAGVLCIRVDEMQQHAAALDMAEKAVAEADALMGALDEAGNVGEDEFAAVAGDDAELRVQRREGIIGDLRARRADRGQKRRFAGVGEANEPGVGDQLQAQPDGALLPLLAGIDAARSLVGRGLEMGVAEAAIAAARERDALADLGHVGDQRFFVLVEDLGSGRNLEDRVGALAAGAVLAHAVGAGLGLEMLLIAVVDQRVEAADAFDDDIAAAAAVAAVRAAEFDEFLAPERQAAGAAVARTDVNLGLIEKFHGLSNGDMSIGKRRMNSRAATAPPLTRGG